MNGISALVVPHVCVYVGGISYHIRSPLLCNRKASKKADGIAWHGMTWLGVAYGFPFRQCADTVGTKCATHCAKDHSPIHSSTVNGRYASTVFFVESILTIYYVHNACSSDSKKMFECFFFAISPP